MPSDYNIVISRHNSNALMAFGPSPSNIRESSVIVEENEQ